MTEQKSGSVSTRREHFAGLIGNAEASAKKFNQLQLGSKIMHGPGGHLHDPKTKWAKLWVDFTT